MRCVISGLLAVVLQVTAAQAAPSPPKYTDPDVTVCMLAAAAADHVDSTQVDGDGCQCATKQLHQLLKPGDYQLHEEMVEVIASGADEKTFNKKVSDIMLKRGMNQQNVDDFLVRSKAAEQKAQQTCNTSPLLGPEPTLKSPH